VPNGSDVSLDVDSADLPDTFATVWLPFPCSIEEECDADTGRVRNADGGDMCRTVGDTEARRANETEDCEVDCAGASDRGVVGIESGSAGADNEVSRVDVIADDGDVIADGDEKDGGEKNGGEKDGDEKEEVAADNVNGDGGGGGESGRTVVGEANWRRDVEDGFEVWVGMSRR
jgi:hypothetical protein